MGMARGGDDITVFVENGLGDMLGFYRVVCCEHDPLFDNDMKNLRFNKSSILPRPVKNALRRTSQQSVPS